MACSTNSIIKYVIYIEPGCYFKDILGDLGPISGAYSINGVSAFTSLTQRVVFPDLVNIGMEMTAGELNSLEIPVGDRKAKSTDGIRNLPDIDLVLRIDSGLNNTANGQMKFFADWWSNRNLWDFNMYIMITNKAYQHLYGYKYTGLTIAKFGTESMGIEDVKKGQIQLKFFPDDAHLVNCNGDVIDENDTNTLPTSFVNCF
jgi:hypothetical protein